MKYYWGNPDITLSFCEKKYNQSYWIAEYNNTISAIPYIVFGCFFLLTKIKHIGVSMIFLGFSTMIMHGTLRYYGQWVDECSMLLISYSAIKTIKNVSNRGYYLLILYYFLIKDYFILFFLMFSSMQIYIVYLTTKKKISYLRNIFIKLYIFCFILGMICWFIDQFLCKHIGDIPFHAIWHLFSAFGMFYGFIGYLI